MGYFLNSILLLLLIEILFSDELPQKYSRIEWQQGQGKNQTPKEYIFIMKYDYKIIYLHLEIFIYKIDQMRMCKNIIF